MSKASRMSRRELLKRAGVVSLSVAVPAVEMLPASRMEQATNTSAPQALETLTAAEFETLEAVVARLIPADENGPGAAEARAAHYIDRALTGALAPSRASYSAGLAVLDEYALESRKSRFSKLNASEQDAVLNEFEKKFTTFFNLVRTHTIQGTFCDPYYGGNANFVGWDLIRYPGVRLSVPAELQRLDAKPEATHRSAYDYPMFSNRKP